MQVQIAELEETLRTLEFKEWYYTTAKKNGSTEVPRNMTLEELPKEYREVRLKLRGKWIPVNIGKVWYLLRQKQNGPMHMICLDIFKLCGRINKEYIEA